MKLAWTKISTFSLALSMLVMLPACWSTDVSNSSKEISASNIAQDTLVIINVLDKEYYDDCHIAGSVNVELQDLENFVRSLNKKTEIVVYCSNYMCTASGAACKQLAKLGFEHVWAYEGGTAEWYKLGLPVKGACKESYLNKKNEKPAHETTEVKTITAQELMSKIEQHNLLK